MISKMYSRILSGMQDSLGTQKTQPGGHQSQFSKMLIHTYPPPSKQASSHITNVDALHRLLQLATRPPKGAAELIVYRP